VTRKKGSPPSNIAHSVKARLLQRARRDGEDFNSLSVRYVLERLLYPLSASPHANEFVLKGACSSSRGRASTEWLVPQSY
jgi:hypothetical protein